MKKKGLFFLNFSLSQIYRLFWSIAVRLFFRIYFNGDGSPNANVFNRILRSCAKVHVICQAWSCIGRGIRAAPKSKITRNPRRGRTVGWLSQFPDFNIDGCGEPSARLRYPMCKLSPCILISRRSICRRLRRRRRRRSLRRGEFAITV